MRLIFLHTWREALPQYYPYSSRISHVGLTTVEHQADSSARAAFSILLERIKGGNAASEIARMEYGHMLLERRSTARYKAPEVETLSGILS